MKRFAILAVFLGLGAITLPQLASDAHVSYRVIHGWPKYDRGFTTGQVTGVAVDSHNCVFVFHREVRPVLRIDGDSGEVLASWGDGIFKQAHGLSVDQKDNVWVTDSDAHAVFKFSHEGELLATFGKKGEPGEDAEHFNRPTDVEVGPDGSIYVAQPVRSDGVSPEVAGQSCRSVAATPTDPRDRRRRIRRELVAIAAVPDA